jgi:hypothetical protein
LTCADRDHIIALRGVARIRCEHVVNARAEISTPLGVEGVLNRRIIVEPIVGDRIWNAAITSLRPDECLSLHGDGGREQENAQDPVHDLAS